MPRLLALGAALGFVLLGAAQLASGSGGSVTLKTFAGGWQAHDRFMTISGTGRGVETVLDSCCQHAITVHFQISKVWGTAKQPMASAKVTYVRLYDPSDYSKQHPAPKVGRVGTLRIVQGVLYETLAGDTYCNNQTKATYKCGA